MWLCDVTLSDQQIPCALDVFPDEMGQMSDIWWGSCWVALDLPAMSLHPTEAILFFRHPSQMALLTLPCIFTPDTIGQLCTLCFHSVAHGVSQIQMLGDGINMWEFQEVTNP